MSKSVLALLLATLGSASFNAMACRMKPPRPPPVYAELARDSDVVAIVRVERIRPMSAEGETRTQQLLDAPPMNVPVRFPTTSAEFSVVRILKGERPKQSLVQNGASSCDVTFLEGKDYLLFAGKPGASMELIPAYGTVEMNQADYSLNALAETESSLTPNPKRP